MGTAWHLHVDGRCRGSRHAPHCAGHQPRRTPRSASSRTNSSTKNGLSAAPLDDGLSQRTNRWVRAEQVGHQRCGLRITKGRKGNGLSTGYPRQCAFVLGAEGDKHQRRRLRNHAQEVRKHRLADLVDPMRVFRPPAAATWVGPAKSVALLAGLYVRLQRKTAPCRAITTASHPGSS